MDKKFVVVVFFEYFTFLCVSAYSDAVLHINLTANEPLQKVLSCGHEYVINVFNIDVTSQYVLFHVHSQWHEVIISENNETEYGHSRVGRDVGLYQMLHGTESTASCHVRCVNMAMTRTQTALLFAQVPTFAAPVPGGCNVEFPLPQDPNLFIDNSTSDRGLITLRWQYANVGSSRSGLIPSCEDAQNHSKLQYKLYEFFIQDLNFHPMLYINRMKKILTMDQLGDMEVLGREVLTVKYNGHTHQDFTVHTKQGVIYTVVVFDTTAGRHQHALYVPVHTYGCDSKASCIETLPHVVLAYIVVCIIGVLGVFIAFFGHRFFKTEMFFFGHVGLMLALLLVLLKFSHYSFTMSIIISGLLAIVGGVAWLLLWYFKGMPLVAIVMPGLVMGFTFASVLFTYTPFGDFEVWKNQVNFGLAFASAVLVLPVIFLYFTKLMNILCCVLVGTFMLMWGVAQFIGGSFKYIVPDTLRALTSNSFLLAESYIPFTTNDIIICSIWVALFFIALVFQLLRERRRPPFPPCPYQQYKSRANRKPRELHQSPIAHAQIENADGFGNESDPLLYPGAVGEKVHGGSFGAGSRSHDGSRGYYGSLGQQGNDGPRSPLEDNSAIIDPL